jgi:hypothetical protein
MKRIYVLGAAALVASVGVAVAQTTPTKPGGNVAAAQGPCAQGYDRVAPAGKMQLTDEQRKNIDTNNDGNISKSEFDNACAKGLFDDAKKN